MTACATANVPAAWDLTLIAEGERQRTAFRRVFRSVTVAAGACDDPVSGCVHRRARV